MKVELFKIDPATRLVDLNKEWIGTIKEFKKILSRDRGSVGDTDGKRKLQATKEFTFIYHFCDYASRFDNYSEKDKLKECVFNAELPLTFDYTKDEELVSAVNRYRTLQESAALKLLDEAKEALHTSHRVIRKCRLALETQLEAVDFDQLTESKEEEEEEPRQKGKYPKKIEDPITKITKTLTNLISLTNMIEPALTNIRNLEELVKKELGDKVDLRGGKAKGTREDAVKTPDTPVPSMFD